MRKVCVYGLDDGLRCELSRDVDIIVKVMEIGKAEDAITFYIVFTGKELKDFMAKNKLENVTIDNSDELLINKIIESNKYEVKAYDW